VAGTRPGLEIVMLTTLIVIGVIVAVVLFLVVGAYNRLVALDQRADQSFADIDVQLKQRQDLIPNLVETVKGYATHERATLDSVIQARAAAAGATSVNDKVQAENMLTGALGRLFALSEAYPDLKANTNFLQLSAELSDIENKLAAARRFFNNAVSEFNAVRRQFPTVLFAAMVGFGSDKPFFDVGEADRATMTDAPPTVNFQA
jgi:LemA protein